MASDGGSHWSRLLAAGHSSGRSAKRQDVDDAPEIPLLVAWNSGKGTSSSGGHSASGGKGVSPEVINLKNLTAHLPVPLSPFRSMQAWQAQCASDGSAEMSTTF